MNLTELGGEFALIRRIARKSKSGNVLVGIGDDCAVVRIDQYRLHLYTVDMLVEGDHFSRAYFTPYDIGAKAMESSVSDIAAMGGHPLYGLVSIALPDDSTVAFLDDSYRGMYDVADRYEFDVIGGDTTHADKMIVDIVLVGEVTPSRLKLRSTAEPGDLIAVSGKLGGSKAGLRLYQNGIEGYLNVKRYHTAPRCDMDQLDRILPIAKAMEDVSDGLASEVRNICRESEVGARLYKDSIPLCDGIRETAALLGDDPLDYALFGGEDFKLVYSVRPDDRSRIVGAVV
ncbi:MAG: thiamine-phosphate kinase, partial [Candidatus Zixiibacteriota bacterium]